MATDEPDPDTKLETPIKIRWTGYARSRIAEYNAGFNHSRAAPYVATMSRQKTNVVIETVEEAEAVHNELSEYGSSQRVWMNGSMDSSLYRVRKLIREGMADRGFAAEFVRSGKVRFEK